MELAFHFQSEKKEKEECHLIKVSVAVSFRCSPSSESVALEIYDPDGNYESFQVQVPLYHR